MIKCILHATSKLKFVEKQLYRKQYAPKLRFYHLKKKKNRMTIKPLKMAAKVIFIIRKINLNVQNLKIISYNQPKKKKKKKKNQIIHGALFLQFSILIDWRTDSESEKIKTLDKLASFM